MMDSRSTCLAAALAVTLSSSAGETPRPFDLAILAGGPAVSVAPKEMGRRARLTFDGKKGQRFDIAIANVNMNPASASALIASLRGPADELVSARPLRCFAASAAASPGDCKVEVEIARDGKHVIEIDSPFSTVSSYSVSLAAVVRKTLTIGGDGVDFQVNWGDLGRFDLDVQAGQGFTLAVENLKLSNEESNAVLGVVTPAGVRTAFVGCVTKGFNGNLPRPCKVAVPASQAAVRYQVTVSPPYNGAVSGKLTATIAGEVK
jgi:hypothetical protein